MDMIISFFRLHELLIQDDDVSVRSIDCQEEVVGGFRVSGRSNVGQLLDRLLRSNVVCQQGGSRVTVGCTTHIIERNLVSISDGDRRTSIDVQVRQSDVTC